MRSRCKSLAISVCAFLLLGAPRLVCQPEVQSPSDGSIKKSVEEVAISFRLSDEHGQAVEDLSAEDFLVLDDGQVIHQFTSLSRNTGLPLRLGIVLDLSGSMTKVLPAAQRSAIALWQQILRTEGDSSFVVGFSSSIRIERRPAQMLDFIDNFRPGGLSAIYDAMYQATGPDLMGQSTSLPIRRAIILLSDGEDTLSRHSADEVIAQAQRGDIAIYTVAVHRKRYVSLSDRILARFAAETGARAILLDSYDRTPEIFRQIVAELRTQYVVTYRPRAPLCGGFHEIRIVVNPARKITVRHPSGYYVAPELNPCDAIHSAQDQTAERPFSDLMLIPHQSRPHP